MTNGQICVPGGVRRVIYIPLEVSGEDMLMRTRLQAMGYRSELTILGFFF